MWLIHNSAVTGFVAFKYSECCSAECHYPECCGTLLNSLDTILIKFNIISVLNYYPIGCDEKNFSFNQNKYLNLEIPSFHLKSYLFVKFCQTYTKKI